MSNPLNESILDKFKKHFELVLRRTDKRSYRMVQVKDTTRTPTQNDPIKSREGVISGMSGMTPKDLLSQYPKFKLANGPKVQVRGRCSSFSTMQSTNKNFHTGTDSQCRYPLTSNPHICTTINFYTTYHR